MKRLPAWRKSMEHLSPIVWASRLGIGGLLVVLTALTMVPVAVASHGNGLIHRYKFDEETGPDAFDHHKTDPIDGVLSTTVNRVDGLAGRGAVEITKDTAPVSVVSIGGGVGQFGTSDFTVAFWLQTSETATALFDLVGNRTAGSCGNFFQTRMTGTHSATGNGRIIAEIATGGTGCSGYIPLISPLGYSYNDGQRHHVAVTRAGTTMTLYVDGVQVASGSAGSVADVANGNPFKIGSSLGSPIGSYNFAVVTIDDLRIFEKALSAEDIEALADED